LALTSGLRSKHFPPREAIVGSGSVRTEVIRSRRRSSLLLSSIVRHLDMSLFCAIRAAAIGILLENRVRSKIAAALRWMGGENNAIGSDLSLFCSGLAYCAGARDSTSAEPHPWVYLPSPLQCPLLQAICVLAIVWDKFQVPKL
jgi:hypothetical protein